MIWKVCGGSSAAQELRASYSVPIGPCIPADYGFEYSDEEQEEQDVDIENQYYNSKGGPGFVCPRDPLAAVGIKAPDTAPILGMLENDDPREAIEGFNQVVSMEDGKGEW